jgi:hypothetical protein
VIGRRSAGAAGVAASVFAVALVAAGIGLEGRSGRRPESPRLRIVRASLSAEGGRALGFLAALDDGGSDDLVGAESSLAATARIVPGYAGGGIVPGAAGGGVEPMSMSMGGMTMRMQVVPVPAHGAMVLERHGPHLELDGLRGALVAGERVPITLDFARAGPVRVEAVVSVGPPAAMAMGDPSPGMPAGGQDAMPAGGQGRVRPSTRSGGRAVVSGILPSSVRSTGGWPG